MPNVTSPTAALDLAAIKLPEKAEIEEEIEHAKDTIERADGQLFDSFQRMESLRNEVTDATAKVDVLADQLRVLDGKFKALGLVFLGGSGPLLPVALALGPLGALLGAATGFKLFAVKKEIERKHSELDEAENAMHALQRRQREAQVQAEQALREAHKARAIVDTSEVKETAIDQAREAQEAVEHAPQQQLNEAALRLDSRMNSVVETLRMQNEVLGSIETQQNRLGEYRTKVEEMNAKLDAAR